MGSFTWIFNTLTDDSPRGFIFKTEKLQNQTFRWEFILSHGFNFNTFTDAPRLSFALKMNFTYCLGFHCSFRF